MCGIAGALLREPNLDVNMDALLDSLLGSIEDRGRDATGFVAVTDDGVTEWQKASCKASVFCAQRRFLPEGTRLMIGHTRLATQGLPSFMENNHPIRRGPYYIVHNGHVRNDDALFETAKRERFGRVDSEAIAARLASFADLASLGEVMEEIEGDAAVAAIDERDPSRLVVARGQYSPLWVYDGRVIVLFASTKAAIEKAHAECVGQLSESKMHYMEEGEQFEWHGEENHRSKFKVPEKFAYSWSNPAGGFLGNAQRQLNEKSWSLKDDDDFLNDELNCDNCNTPMSYLDTEYRYDNDEDNKRTTFFFCDECAQLWDYDRLGGILDAEFEEEDDDDDDSGATRLEDLSPLRLVTEDDLNGYDDYAGANQSIVRSFMDRFGI